MLYSDINILLVTDVHVFIRAPKSENEWLSALKLATMWGMSNVRRTAINEISQLKSMSDADQVVFGKDYAVVDWVMSGCRALTKPNRGIVSIEDASRLTLPICLKVWQGQLSLGISPREISDEGILDYIFSSELDEVYERGLTLGDEARPRPPRFSGPGGA